MKPGVLFSHSYFYRFDPKQWRARQPYPPLGTITAASWLRKHGFEVSLFDTNLAYGPEELTPHLDKTNPEYLVLYDDGFNYLTKMCLTRMREAAFEMIWMARERGVTVIVSSSDSTDHYEDYLAKGAHYVIIGEGEQTLLELLNMGPDDSIEEVKGVAYLSDEKAVKTASRPVLKDLDQLPMAAWDLIDMESYRSIWNEGHGYFSLNIATTRGCPFKCNWCAKPIYGNRYNSRSPQHVLDEMEYLQREHGAEHFWMCDDIFGLKPRWVQSFRELALERKLEFRYKIQSRVDLLQVDDTIEALAESGLETVWLGAESGSQEILDAMDKGIRVEQIYEVVPKLQARGIKVGLFLQFGYLGETMEDIRKTIKMLLDTLPDEIGISVSYPLPGTGFYDRVKSDLKEKQNWKDSDDLDLMFNNTYPPRFYKRLHRYVHNRHQLKKGLSKGLRPGKVTRVAYHFLMGVINGSSLRLLAKRAI